MKTPGHRQIIIRVLREEYRRRITSRTFFVSTLIGCLITICLAAVPNLAPIIQSNNLASRTGYPIIITGDKRLRIPAEQLLRVNGEIRIVEERNKPEPFQNTLDDGSTNAAHADLQLSIRNHHLYAIVVSDDSASSWKGRLRPLLALSASIATGEPLHRENAAIQLPYKVVAPRHPDNMTPRLKSSEEAVGSMLMAGLYGLILVGSQILLGSVSEEKTNRVAEMLAAIGRPRDYLAGKIGAACALGVSQILVWTTVGVAAFAVSAQTLAKEMAKQPLPTQEIARVLPPLIPSLETVAVFIIFAPLAYLQFASVYTAAASLVSRPEDITMVATPLAIPVALSILCGIYVSDHSQSITSHILSYMPLVSAFAMTGRASNGTVSLIEIISVFGFQLALTIASLEVAARVYHIGLTTYGSYPSVPRILRMIKQG